MRMPSSLPRAIKDRASERGIPYTRYIRELLEREVHSSERESDENKLLRPMALGK